MNVTLSFTEPAINDDGSVATMQTPTGTKPVIASVGAYFCKVPNEQLSSFKELVVQKGGKLEKETPDRLRYNFHGQGACLVVDSLATPFMYQ